MGLNVLAVVVSALVISSVHGQEPMKCCVPPQYTVAMIDLESINTDQMSVLFMELDFENNLQAIVNYTYDPLTQGYAFNYRIIVDMKQNMLYMLSNNDTSCTKQPDPIIPVRCIPDNAQYMGSSYLGPLGEPLKYNGWRFSIKAGAINTMAVSECCVPLVEGVAIPQYPAYNRLFMYSNFQPRLTDPTLLVIPDICHQ